MGLFSKNTKSRSNPSLPRIIILLSLFTLILILIFQVDHFVSETKTIVGHNLEPTPWHEFPAKKFEEESKYSRASKIIQCSYLTCGGRTSINRVKQNNVTFTNQRTVKCPEFFRWIHHDLEPWLNTRITLDHVMKAKEYASMRVVIIEGKMYVDYYYACVQSRAMFTVWGIMQLLRRYPGKVPDVDFMFDCMDKPIINRTEHSSMPLPLFRYCTTPDFFDIPFPDWSFWGWSETNIRPWDIEFESIKKGSGKQKWPKKIPLAYWKGNPEVFSEVRTELVQCNDTKQSGAEILRQDWAKAEKDGFEESKLSNQCNHRYKIYAEGYAWSVSLKYILSCSSTPLIITPKYDDFFSRGLFPKENFWPIPPFDLCRNIKEAVDWGNSHPDEAEAIGKKSQNYMKNLNMDRIYDYMYYLITEYAKLLDFKPIRPSSAFEVCENSLLCFANEKQREFLENSTAFLSPSPPCKMHVPDNAILNKWIEDKRKIMDTLITPEDKKKFMVNLVQTVS